MPATSCSKDKCFLSVSQKKKKKKIRINSYTVSMHKCWVVRWYHRVCVLGGGGCKSTTKVLSTSKCLLVFSRHTALQWNSDSYVVLIGE